MKLRCPCMTRVRAVVAMTLGVSTVSLVRGGSVHATLDPPPSRASTHDSGPV